MSGSLRNSTEHKERVERLKQKGQAVLLAPDGKGKARWGSMHENQNVIPPPFTRGCFVEVRGENNGYNR